MWQFLKQYFMPEHISELDQFLQHFDDTHPPSTAQQQEVERCRRLSHKRDHSSS